jgi:hypothetical protein
MEQAIGVLLQAGASTLAQAELAAQNLHSVIGGLSQVQILATAGIVLALQIYSIGFIVYQRRQLTRAHEDVSLLANEITRINQELNVERLWRLAGTQNPELPEETLKKLYRVVTDERMAS